MSGYDVEHSIPTHQQQSDGARRRPDLSTFYSALDQLTTSAPGHERHNPHAIPTPADISAVYGLLADAFIMMRPDDEGMGRLADQMRSLADNPPREVEGVPDSFLDELDRVPKKSLKETDTCPICGLPFLDDPYPLVVELPCHTSHRFDLDCIRPWLKLNSTCPLDRKDLLKKKTPPPPPEDDDEEDWDDQYA